MMKLAKSMTSVTNGKRGFKSGVHSYFNELFFEMLQLRSSIKGKFDHTSSLLITSNLCIDGINIFHV
jgi:hypothetical protein